MSSSPFDLEALRRRIDDIDDRLHDLLMERIAIIEEVSALKTHDKVATHQPAREAAIIRRLVERNSGALPGAAVVRIWRELLATAVRLEGPFAVAVYAPPESQGFWDLARDHYGSQTPMSAYRSIGQVIRAVSEGQAAAGVLPMPQEGDPDPWWRHLLSADDASPRVIARLPFGPRGNARSDVGDALSIGSGPQQATGQDRTLLIAENAPDVSRGRVFDTLSAAGLICTLLASYEHGEGSYHLIELDGFVPVSDPRIQLLQLRLGAALHRLLPFGGYAVPLPLATLPPQPAAVAQTPAPSRRATGAAVVTGGFGDPIIAKS